MNNDVGFSAMKQTEPTSRSLSRSIPQQLDEAFHLVVEKINILEARILEMRLHLDDPNRQKFNNIHFYRNVLPNDSALNQKIIVSQWNGLLDDRALLDYKDFLDSGFRVFSQNDEDGVILRIFAAIGVGNKFVIEIGSNCAGSQLDIPENLSTNLVVNHGWHALVFERDLAECKRMQHFFAQNPATKHFHLTKEEHAEYYSPHISCAEISVSNLQHYIPPEIGDPDLLVIDIDSIDYRVLERLDYLRPRVIVVEIEKSFRDAHSVIMKSPELFNRSMRHSGTTSLMAWTNLLTPRGYYLCALSAAGFNAFFVRSDVAQEKIKRLSAKDAFDMHPIFSKLPKSFWIVPDNEWQEV